MLESNMSPVCSKPFYAHHCNMFIFFRTFKKMNKDRQFSIALGSHAETEYLFSFSKKLGYHQADTSQTENLLAEVGRLLWSFYRSL